ncbi:hypothetical protein JXJ21_14380 [candidate division KSB1 bacterium]|nr:hypothetical protein [candidate division KSB1 bacterium]
MFQRMSIRAWIAILYYAIPSIICAQQDSFIPVKPIRLSENFQNSSFISTIYSIDAEFTAEDTILFSEKEEYLQIDAVDFVDIHELNFTLKVLNGFGALGPRELYVVDRAGTKKAKARLQIQYQPKPEISRIKTIIGNKICQDTLQLEPFGATSAELILSGKGFFAETQIRFDDPAIEVYNDNQHRSIYAPDSLSVRVLINENKQPEIGSQRFTVQNPFAKESEARIILRSAAPPKITTPLPNFVAEGNEQLFEIKGMRFSKYCEVKTLPAEESYRSEFISPEELKFYLTLPILQENKGYRVVVTNPDGQADTSSTFFAMAKPLAPATAISASNKELFAGGETRIEVVVRMKKYERLSSKTGYEVSFGKSRFPVERIKNDSTMIALVELPPPQSDLPESFFNFTVNPVGLPSRWKGSLKAKSPPKITFMTPNRILHPMDTLHVMIKGNSLDRCEVVLEDPELVAQVLEASEDRMRFSIIAGRNISLTTHSLVLKKGNVLFNFDNYQFDVRNWEDFNKFVALESRAFGTVAPERLWSGTDRMLKIKSGDHIFLKFYGRKIASELGIQKIMVTGVVLDSTNAVRAVAADKKIISLGNSNQIITWNFRVRQGIRSGDRVEITISNPGNQNRVSELFYVERHWFEAFRGASTIALVKIPIGGGNSNTELLKNIGFGINWQPWAHRKFLSFDGVFIVGNPATTDSTVNIEVGFGVSAVLWNYIQIGLGTNFTGDAFANNFIFLGTRFKLPLPK